MKTLYLVILLASIDKIQAQSFWNNVTLSAAYLSSTDYSIQNFQGGGKERPKIEDYLCFEIEMSKAVSRWWVLESGYRYKQVPLTYNTSFSQHSSWVEELHSVPVRLKFIPNLGAKMSKRWTLGVSSGVLMNFMRRSSGAPLILDQQFTVFQPSGEIYNFSAQYEEDEINQVNNSLSFNIQGNIAYRFWKSLGIAIGYGYVHGNKQLAKGNYQVTIPRFTYSGTAYTKGSYSYIRLALTYLLRR